MSFRQTTTTRWICDRCGTTSSVENSGGPPGDWAKIETQSQRDSLPVVVGLYKLDLCGGCVASFKSWWKK